MENIKTIKFARKRSFYTDICLKSKEGFTFDSFSMSKSIQKFYLNLANDLVHIFPSAARKFDIEYVEKYYMFDLSHNELTFRTVQTKSVSNLLKTFDTNKAI